MCNITLNKARRIAKKQKKRKRKRKLGKLFQMTWPIYYYYNNKVPRASSVYRFSWNTLVGIRIFWKNLIFELRRITAKNKYVSENTYLLPV